MDQPADLALRDQLAGFLGWEDAHAGFDRAVDGLPAQLRGAKPAGFPHTAWQLVEHMRLAQADILDFCRNQAYEEPQWPRDYWPAAEQPPGEDAWQNAVEAFRRDRHELRRLVKDPGLDLLAEVPRGDGRTYFREVLLVADHTAYHVGQLVALRRQLGAWPARHGND